MYINTPWNKTSTKSINKTRTRLHSSHGDGTKAHSWLKRKRLAKYDSASISTNRTIFKREVWIKCLENCLNHYRIRASRGYENCRSSINHSVRLHERWVRVWASFIGQQHLNGQDDKTRKLEFQNTTGVWPSCNVMVVRPSSSKKAPRLWNRAPVLDALDWALNLADGSVTFTWFSSWLANCCQDVTWKIAMSFV